MNVVRIILCGPLSLLCGAKRPRWGFRQIRVMRPRGEPGEHVSDVHGVLVRGAPGAGAGAGAGAGVTEATVPRRMPPGANGFGGYSRESMNS